MAGAWWPRPGGRSLVARGLVARGLVARGLVARSLDGGLWRAGCEGSGGWLWCVSHRRLSRVRGWWGGMSRRHQVVAGCRGRV